MPSRMVYRKSSSLIIFALVITILQNFIMKLWFIEAGSIVNQIDEALMLICLLLLIAFRNSFSAITTPKFLYFVFVSYWLIAIISSIFGDVVIGQSALQAFLDLKFFVFSLFCILFYDTTLVWKLEKVIKSVILINIPFVMWQFLFQESYDNVFASGAHFGLIYDSEGEGLSRAAGVFWFTGIYALFCAMSLGYFYSKKLVGNKFEKTDFFYLIVSIVLLFLSLSRGEIASAIVAILFVNILFSGVKYFKPVTALGFFFVLLLIAILYGSSIQKWAIELGIISGAVELAPRALFMQSSLDIGYNYFPLGAGLGAFGGKAAVEYDSHFFYQYLISHEWYFNYGMYLTDTFWPKVIAETGFLGMGLFLAGLLYVVSLLKNKNVEVVYSTYAICFMLINSISTPIFNDAFSVLIAFSLLGAAFYKNGKN